MHAYKAMAIFNYLVYKMNEMAKTHTPTVETQWQSMAVERKSSLMENFHFKCSNILSGFLTVIS